MTLYDASGALVRVWDTSGRLVFGDPVDPPDPPDPVTPPEGPVLNVGRRCSAVGIGRTPVSQDGTFAETAHPLVVDTIDPVLEWVIAPGFVGISTGGTVRAAVRVNDGPRVNVTWGGFPTTRIEVPTGLSTLKSDPVPIKAYARDEIRVLAWIDPDGPGAAPADLTSLVATDAGTGGGGWQTSPTLTPVASSAQLTGGTWSLRPSRVVAPSDQPAWVAVGDSIVQQTWSWPERTTDALAYATVKSAMGGDAYIYYPSRWETRMGAHLTHAHHVLDEFGINDVGGNDDVLVVAARALRFWRLARDAGVTDYIKSTLTLAASSSDNWATLEGQTVTREPGRSAFNTWLRDGAPLTPDGTAPVAVGTVDAIRCTTVSPSGTVTTRSQGHPVTAVTDVVAAIESSPNSGKYAIGAPSQAMQGHSDGLHPAPGIHALLATRLTRDLRLLGY